MSTSTTPAVEMFECSFGQTAKLTSTNFASWNSDIKIFLRAEGVLDIALGNETPPPAGNAQAAIKATKSYRKRVGKAYGILVGSCSLLVRAYINDMDDPTEIWTTLKEKVGTASSQAEQLALFRAFQTSRPLDSDTSISQYIARLIAIRDQLAGTEEEIADRTIVSHLLTTLPPAFHMIQRVIISVPRETRTLSYVINTLLEEEKNTLSELSSVNTGASTSLTSGSAPAARGNYKDRQGRGGREGYRGRGGYRGHGRGIHKSTSSRRIHGSCWYCGNQGHMESECRKLQREQREQ